MDDRQSRDIIKRREFIVDLVEIATYLGEQSDATLTARFIDAVENTIDQIVSMPGIGSIKYSSEFGILRTQQVQGFRAYLVFYKPTEDEIVFLRLIHGSRDLETILSEE